MLSPVILRSPNLAEGEEPIAVRIYTLAPRTQFKNGGLARAAEAVRSAGRLDDEILLHINPEEFRFLKKKWGEPTTNPHTGLPEYGIFKKIKKALKFESFNVKKIVKGVLKNPDRLLTGAIDPLGTKISNKMHGTDYKPLVNQLGGATEDTFREAEAKGMSTNLARDLHKTAGVVAGFYGGNALGNLASSGLGNVATGLEAYGAANSLTPAMTSVAKTGDVALATQMGQLTPVTSTVSGGSTFLGSAANAGAQAARYGEGALSNLGDKAIDYAKKPSNWGTIAKGAAALGALGGAGGAEAAEGPTMSVPGGEFVPGEAQPFNRVFNLGDMDWYTYGENPEHQFYTSNIAPGVIPGVQTPRPVKGAKHGGPLSSRYVRGPGSGRSDSIPAQLSDGEYVFTAEDVALLGDGSNEAGARRLDEFRTQLRRHKGGALARGKISPNAKAPMEYLKGVSRK